MFIRLSVFKGNNRDNKGHFIKEVAYIKKRVSKIGTINESDTLFKDFVSAIKRANIIPKCYIVGELVGKGGIVKKYHS